MARRTLILLFAFLLVAGPAEAASPVEIGREGEDPAVAVDPAGTAYISWVAATADPTKLFFCRIPRGQIACAGGVKTIPTENDGTSISRPYVQVDGNVVRVLSYRYALGASYGRFDADLLYISRNGGDTWDAAKKVGNTPFNDAVRGPGVGISLATNAYSEGGIYQSVRSDEIGDFYSESRAKLFEFPFVYNATVAIANIDNAEAPLVVSTDALGNARYRQGPRNAITGGGDPNNGATWTPPAPDSSGAGGTPPAEITGGRVDYPRLAAGRSGVFLSGEDGDGLLKVRRYDPVNGFAAPVTLKNATGESPSSDMTQDPAGRLHVLLPQITAAGMRLYYATSDDGIAWQARQFDKADPLPQGVRAAVAGDHLGWAVWHNSDHQIIAMEIGPTGEAPAAVLPRSAPASARISGPNVVMGIQGTLAQPQARAASQRTARAAQATTCTGGMRARVLRGKRRIAQRRTSVASNCTFKTTIRFKARKLRGARKVTLVLRYGGSSTIGPATKRYTVSVKR